MKTALAMLLVLSLTLSSAPAALAATSTWMGSTSDFNTGSNWDSGVPNDIAAFNVPPPGTPTAITITNDVTLNSFAFDSSAPSYTFTLPNFTDVVFNGAGITSSPFVVPNSVQTMELQGGNMFFQGSSNTGYTTFNVAVGALIFDNSSTASGAKIINTNNGSVQFIGNSNATGAVITNSANLHFSGSSTLGSAFITNNGSLGFSQTASGGGTILNNGTLQVTQSATLAGTQIFNSGLFDISSSGLASVAVGRISGSGSILLGSHQLDMTNTTDVTISGIISGAGGSVFKTGSGTLTLSGANAYTGLTQIGAGGLHLTGSLAGAVSVAGTAFLSGTGTIGALTNNGTVTPGVSGVGTLTAASYSGTGTLQMNFNGASRGLLHVLGTADLTGGTLTFSGSDFAVGRYTVISAGALAGTFGTINGLSAPLLSFTPGYSATDAFVLVNFSTPFASYAQTSNQHHLADNLSAAKTTSTAEFTNAINTLAVLPASAIPEAYGQISGDALASFQNIDLQNAAVFTQGMRERTVNVSSGSYGVWAHAVGFFNSMDGDSAVGSPAAQATTGGFQAGYDILMTDELTVGFSGGYTQTSLDVTDRNSSGDMGSTGFGIYAHWLQDAWFAHGSLAYTAGAHEMDRTIRYGTLHEQTNARFNSKSFTTFVEGGRAFARRGVTIEPLVSLRQSHQSQNGFTETNAPGLDLAVADHALDSWVSNMGVRLGRSVWKTSSHPVDLNFRIGWDHEWGDTDNALSAHFAETSGGSDFMVEGTPRDSNAAVIGLEGRMPLRTNLELFTNYAATLGSLQTMQKILGGVRWTW